MNILEIQYDSIGNGKGLRTVIYVSGCSHFCNGCHNPSSWNVANGVNMTLDEVINIIKSQKYSDVTISGGDPLTLQFKDTLRLVKRIKSETNKNIWLYTGYKFEELLTMDNKADIINYIDVLVDGKFEKNKRDISLCFKGSKNQRVIDVKKSKKMNKTILLDV